MTYTPELRAEIEAVMAKATPAPWRHYQRTNANGLVVTRDEIVSGQDNRSARTVVSDVDFDTDAKAIVAAVNGVKPLTAHIDAQAAQIARMREALARYGHHDARCASNTILTSLPPKRNPCDCGFSAAIAGDA